MLPSCSNLIYFQRYLNRYARNDQPAAYEYLVASTISQIFFLPFQSRDNENNAVKNRVIWQGSINRRSNTISKSPSGPDVICFAYGFYVLIESTLREGTSQWRKEFVESLKHYDDFVTINNVDKKKVYLIVIAPKIHKDTYTGFKQKASEGYNIVVLKNSHLAKIAKCSGMISTIRHLDLCYLFVNLVKILRESAAFDKIMHELNKTINKWQSDVFKQEKEVFFGLKAYEAMKKVPKNIVGTADILFNLERDRKFNYYLNILGVDDIMTYITNGLLSEKLAYLITTPYEQLFCKVNIIDFKARGLRMIKAVEEIHGQP